MKVLEPYIQHLESLVGKLGCAEEFQSESPAIEAALDGELSKTLRKQVPLEKLQEAGAFFTGDAMADKLVSTIPEGRLRTSTVLDASCGGGNLLLAYARRLPVEKDLLTTVMFWGEQIKGLDLHEEFVRATRARLMLMAALRGFEKHGKSFLLCSLPPLEEVFPEIRQSNSLDIDWPNADFFLLNPPFNVAPVPDWCKWSTGRVSQAALFIIKCLEGAEKGSIIRAILPDVLRSGTRYNKWRNQVQKVASIESIEVLGQFDTKTHVDVFLLTLKVGFSLHSVSTSWASVKQANNVRQTIGSRCSVQVGRVVPHRDLEEGKEYCYLDVRHLPPWKHIIPGEARRKFMGSVFETPFVIVRRTSRAADLHRAVGTLVRTKNTKKSEKVAVENHLLVLRPTSGSLEECEKLLCLLKDSRTNDWLNQMIRCRHLTVTSVQSIPWWEDE